MRTEANYLLLLLVLLTLIGWNSGHFLFVYLVGLACFIVWTLSRARQLNNWLNGNIGKPPPYISGFFGHVAQKYYQTELRHQKFREHQQNQMQRISKLANALNEGVIILKDGVDLDWWNPSAESLLHFRKEDRGNPIQNLIRNPTFIRYLNDKEFSTPLELPAPKNPTQILLYSGAEFDQQDVVIVVRDVTRLRRLEQMRKDFVANISHELRTPLTVLTGYLETLQDSSENLPPSYNKALREMKQQANRMNLLANDLVTLSQLESANKELPETSIELLPIVSQVQKDAEALSGGAHEIVLEPCTQQLHIRGNPKELYSALSNLVFNAVRHNPAGTRITIRCKENASGKIQVDVEDNGIGIDPIHIPRLTERFYRVDTSRNSSSGGTGLGLAIVKHVLLHHQASLQIQSTLTKGSKFSCIFPRFDAN